MILADPARWEARDPARWRSASVPAILGLTICVCAVYGDIFLVNLLTPRPYNLTRLNLPPPIGQLQWIDTGVGDLGDPGLGASDCGAGEQLHRATSSVSPFHRPISRSGPARRSSTMPSSISSSPPPSASASPSIAPAKIVFGKPPWRNQRSHRHRRDPGGTFGGDVADRAFPDPHRSGLSGRLFNTHAAVSKGRSGGGRARYRRLYNACTVKIVCRIARQTVRLR